MAADLPLIRIVDDNPDLLESLGFMLRCEGYRIETYGSAEEFLQRGDMLSPGCLILDVRMPGLSGLELQRRLVQSGCSLPVIFLTAHGDVEMAVGAMHLGANDFQPKPVDPEKMLISVARAVGLDRNRREGAGDIGDEVDKSMTLTAQEEKILRAVARGFTSRTIAERLGISKRTVEHHRAAAEAKTGIRDPAGAAAFFERVDNWKRLHGL